MTTLRAASFNIRNGRAFDGCHSWPFRRHATAAAIADLDAQVIGLQETYPFQLSWLRRRLGRYDAVGLGRNNGRRGERCAVLFDPASVRLVHHLTRWYGDEPDRPGSRLPGAAVPRIATICRMELAETGTAFQVVCTHLDARSTDLRARSIAQLIGWLDPELPQLVLGDLNSTPSDPVLEPLAASGLRQALPAGAGGTLHGFSGRTDGARIDHILVNDRIEVLRVEIRHPRSGQRLPSDHWPIVADIRIVSVH